MRSRNTLYVAIFFVLSFFVFNFGINLAHASNPGVIDTSALNQAKVCHDSSCTSYGIINFELQSQPSIIIDSNNGITGKIWGNELGWITMNPTNGGVTFLNAHTGVLTGKAWSQVSGWINFAPTNQGVTINPDTGEFSGYAWSGGAYGGWIKFDCGDASTCVKTTWRPITTTSSSGPGCGSKCTSCPAGFVLVGGQCLHVDPPFDMCPNEFGIQAEVPKGEHLNSNGQCVPDVNIPNDVCPNIPLVQNSVPTGKHLENGQCVDNVVDVCPNIDGAQTSIPVGKQITGGQCVDIVNPDFCPNIDGDQEVVPDGMHIEGGQCVNNTTPPPPPPPPDDNPTHPVGPGGGGENGGGGFVPDIVNNVQTRVLDFVDKFSNIIKSPEGNLISKFVATIGLISGVFALFSVADIGLTLLRLWSLLLYGMGFKKRNRPWGVVYDSITKQPLDPAYVVLNDMQGKEIGSSITDLDGRYGFLVSPGMYRIVASKTNYTYPSLKLAGRTSDELYNDLYFGENIEIKEEGEIIAKNIPLDAIGFDWNEFAKKEQKRMKFYHTRDVWVSRFSEFMFFLGFLVSVIILFVVPKPYNVIIFFLYLLLLLIRRTTIQRNKKGRVFYSVGGAPVSYGILRVKAMYTGQEVAHRVLDKTGNYYCLIPNGIYNISVEKKNDDLTYTKVYNSDNFEVRNGLLKKDFKI